MRNGEGVAKLVDRFFQQAVLVDFGIGRQTVKFLPQTMRGDDGTTAVKLGFSKNKGEDRNIEIDGSDRENAVVLQLTVKALRQGRQDFGGRILLASEVESEFRIRFRRKQLAA